MSRRHRHSRRRRNPFSTGGLGSVAVKVGGGLAGGIAAGVVPGMVSSSLNTGWTGVLSAAVLTGAGAFLLKRMSPNASEGWLIGGSLQTVGRVAQMLIGKNLVSFSLGRYGAIQFPVPQPGYAATTAPSAVVASIPAGGSSVTSKTPTAMSAKNAPVSKWSARAS